MTHASRKFVYQDAPVTLAIASIPEPESHEAEPVAAMSGCGWVALIIGVLVLLAVAGAVLFAGARDAMPTGPDFSMPRATDDDSMSFRARNDVRMLGQAVERYRLRADGAGLDENLPRSLQDLIDGPADWEGEWHSLLASLDVPQDPWGNEYVYRVVDEESGEFEVVCFGSDGMPGGEGTAADIYYPAR